jgi:hypothetical protein
MAKAKRGWIVTAEHGHFKLDDNLDRPRERYPKKNVPHEATPLSIARKDDGSLRSSFT